MTWEPGAPGVVVLPSGRRVRGRGLRRGTPDGPPAQLVVALLGRAPDLPGEVQWVRWPDFRLPAAPDQALAVLGGALERAARERVELVCGGGRGRTGTALAALAVLDGVPAAQAVAWVREHYHRRAVETPWQRRWVERLER